MSIFSKKGDEEDSSDSSSDSSNNNNSNMSSSALSGNSSKDIVLLRKDLDTVKAIVNTLREMKKDDSDRFQKMNEQIGELRNMLFDKEQELKDMRIQVAKAIDLVSQAQVEKVLIEKKKEDARITMLDAKLDSYKALTDQMMIELKSIRSKIDMYKGVEQVITLNAEVKRNLMNTNLIKMDIDKHADKIEGMFINFNKKFDEFRNNRSEMAAMAHELQDNIKRTNKLEIDSNNQAKKEDFAALREEVSEKLKFAEDYKTRFETLLKQMNEKSRISYIDNAIKQLQDTKNSSVEQVSMQVSDVQSKVLERETQYQQLYSMVNDWLNYLQGKMAYYDSLLGIPSSNPNNSKSQNLQSSSIQQFQKPVNDEHMQPRHSVHRRQRR